MYILQKIKNQAQKLRKKVHTRKLKKYLGGFKSVGSGCFIQFPVCVEGREFVSLGNNVSINSFVHIWGQGNLTIGNDTLIASHVAIVTVTHDTEVQKFNESIVKKPITIGNNVWLGSHSVILPGVIIEDNVIVGAGSVVSKNLSGNAVYAGSPAKKIRDLAQFKSV